MVAAALGKVVQWATTPIPDLDQTLANYAPDRGISSLEGRRRDLVQALWNYNAQIVAFMQKIDANALAKDRVNLCLRIRQSRGLKSADLVPTLTEAAGVLLTAQAVQKQASETFRLLAYAWRAAKQLVTYPNDYKVTKDSMDAFRKDCDTIVSHLEVTAGTLLGVTTHIENRIAQHEEDLRNRCSELNKDMTWDTFMEQTKRDYVPPLMERFAPTTDPFLLLLSKVPGPVVAALRAIGITEEEYSAPPPTADAEEAAGAEAPAPRGEEAVKTEEPAKAAGSGGKGKKKNK